jgi:hypothetical protein
VVAPVLFGAIIAGRNHVTHHLVRALVVVALAVFYSMVRDWREEIEQWLGTEGARGLEAG